MLARQGTFLTLTLLALLSAGCAYLKEQAAGSCTQSCHGLDHEAHTECISRCGGAPPNPSRAAAEEEETK
ncbi:hypothetical protein [Chondromyces apiculatus]|uniref:Lipoprotein n=1 Tax=Chondromyces apiculatus DSM 436 TaxID=1192034 RepID=A0A017T672_9BACT|nr:hypothetical protein [Chondromyces apiculatus]EYF04719.1 Hypothetical protein CAP_4194 [Chondromyces apiculatus DSM 436]